MSLLCLSLQLNAGLVRASSDDNYPSSGEFHLHLPSGDVHAIQLDANIDLRVTGLLAELTLTQTFLNNTNDWVEGSYLFPLHEESAVQGLTMAIGDRRIIAQIMPKAKAKATYEDAKDAGQIASLVEQQRPNLFKMNASSIAPNDQIKIHLSIVLPIEVVDNTMWLRLPTTLTPRYSNALTPDSNAIESPFATHSMIRGPRININAVIEPLINSTLLSSQTHELTHTQQGFSITDAPMDQDIVVQWPVPVEQSVSSHAYVSEFNGERYVQIMMMPPNRVATENTIARELVLLIDKSGSMAGVSMDAAREALHFALDGLKHNDTFNIVAFDHDYYPLFQQAQAVTVQSTVKARRFIDALEADGGTEMQSAVNFVLKKSHSKIDPDEKTEKPRLRQIVFLTDGSVGYEEALLKSIERKLGNNRLFTIGIGPAPNSWFIKKAAEIGRGTSLEIKNTFDVADAVSQLLGKLETPVLTDISIQYPQGHGEIYPNPLPDLYADKPGLWVSRVSADVNEVIITGKQNGTRTSETIKLTEPETLRDDTNSIGSAASPVAMHWARKKVSSLLDEQRYSHDSDMHKTLITDIALDVGLVTPYTSFVAVDENPNTTAQRPVTNHQVANLIPAGNQMMHISMPQGSAGADTWLWLSFIFGGSGLMLLLASRYKIKGNNRVIPA